MKFRMSKKTVFCFMVCMCLFFTPLNAMAQDGGYDVFSDLWLKSVLRTSIGNLTLIWKEVGRDITPSGDKVISGYFYADPDEFAYGSQYNPEVFVKIYAASNGWANIAFNHVTVDNVDVYSAHHYNGAAQQSGTMTLGSRLAEHSYTGVSGDADFTPPPSTAEASPYQDGGYILFSDLWAKSLLRTSAENFTLKWKEVGADTTPSGDKVISGYFYADPDEFAYGSEYNPELFVKVYVASNGWANIAFNHVTVDPVEVYSAHSYNGRPDHTGTATMGSRLAEHSYTGVFMHTDDPDGGGIWGSRIAEIQGVSTGVNFYDSQGRLNRMEFRDNGITDEAYIYIFDTNGRLSSMETDIDNDGTIDLSDTFFYDQNGHLVSEDTRDYDSGTVYDITNYIYDSRGKLLRTETDDEVDGSVDDIEKYIYDVNGRLTKTELFYAEDNTVDTVIYEYDEDGRIILWKWDFGNNGTIDGTAPVIWEEGKCREVFPENFPAAYKFCSP